MWYEDSKSCAICFIGLSWESNEAKHTNNILKTKREMIPGSLEKFQ